MNRAERWLFTTALNICVVPMAALGIIFGCLPDRIPIVLLGQTVAETTSKYNDLSLCLFMLIPLGMLILSTVLRHKKLIDRNYLSVTVSTMLIASVFTGVLLYSFARQSEIYEYARSIDFSTFVCVLLCIALSFIGTLMYGLKPNEAMGFRNRHTAAAEEVWTKTHDTLSFICNGVFAALAGLLSFFRGWHVVVIVVAAAILFVFAVAPIVSVGCHKSYDKKTAREKVGEETA